jgi:ribosomal protein S8
MAKTLVIEVPDELEQQLIVQAEQLNLPIESIVLRSITESIGPSTPSTLIAQATYFLVAETFTLIRKAQSGGQFKIEIPVIPTTEKILVSLKQYGFIVDFQPSELHPQTHRIVYLNPGQPHHAAKGEDAPVQKPMRNSTEVQNLSPEVAKIIQDLQQDDVATRLTAIDALRDLYLESA